MIYGQYLLVGELRRKEKGINQYNKEQLECSLADF